MKVSRIDKLIKALHGLRAACTGAALRDDPSIHGCQKQYAYDEVLPGEAKDALPALLALGAPCGWLWGAAIVRGDGIPGE